MALIDQKKQKLKEKLKLISSEPLGEIYVLRTYKYGNENECFWTWFNNNFDLKVSKDEDIDNLQEGGVGGFRE